MVFADYFAHQGSFIAFQIVEVLRIPESTELGFQVVQHFIGHGGASVGGQRNQRIENNASRAASTNRA